MLPSTYEMFHNSHNLVLLILLNFDEVHVLLEGISGVLAKRNVREFSPPSGRFLNSTRKYLKFWIHSFFLKKKAQYLRTRYIYFLSKLKYTHSIKWRSGREVKPQSWHWVVDSNPTGDVHFSSKRCCYHAQKSVTLVFARSLHRKRGKSCQKKMTEFSLRETQKKRCEL